MATEQYNNPAAPCIPVPLGWMGWWILKVGAGPGAYKQVRFTFESLLKADYLLRITALNRQGKKSHVSLEGLFAVLKQILLVNSEM